MTVDPSDPRVARWIEEDPDAENVRALQHLVDRAALGDAAAAAEISSSFGSELTFGTAGIRGPMGPGPNRMNEVIVRRASSALAQVLRRDGGTRVLIGYDGRHKSRRFAEASASVFAGHGLSTVVFGSPVPTPVLAFGVRQFGFDAGVMVTASHNPPADNGLKIYLKNGSQIVPPDDEAVADLIRQKAHSPLAEIPNSPDWDVGGDDFVREYVDTVASLARATTEPALTFVYTPLHGVGRDVFLSVLSAAGFSAPTVVPEQGEPHGDFPTVEFPNPEEPGAMDLAMQLAERERADLVIAHDPDADRCAVAVPDHTRRSDSWRRLTGDEVGAMLAWWLFVGRPPQSNRSSPTSVVAQSIVSGTMVESIANRAGCRFVRTLTGFKWISRVPDLAFGYEEALGYCVDPLHVADKDGISAALVVLELAEFLKSQNLGVVDLLERLEEEYGVHLNGQRVVRTDSAQEATRRVLALTDHPPERLAHISVSSVVDLRKGHDGLPPTDGIVLELENNCRIIVRPSGTESKIKIYLHVRQPKSQRRSEDRDLAEQMLRVLSDAVLEILETTRG